ncbi:unnamed protein product [Dicrocoelium dendriticum]|nr:unnamed protein product [Dicrocoelium dendriticum]
MRQRQTETPHQWYLRFCDVVERGLPPGPRQEWEVLSTFVRGPHPRYQQASVPGNLPPIADIIQRCSRLDAKARLADQDDKDFFEFELPLETCDFSEFRTLLAKEFSIDPAQIKKVRKLPNTVIRNESDLKRLVNGVELEVVL